MHGASVGVIIYNWCVSVQVNFIWKGKYTLQAGSNYILSLFFKKIRINILLINYKKINITACTHRIALMIRPPIRRPILSFSATSLIPCGRFLAYISLNNALQPVPPLSQTFLSPHLKLKNNVRFLLNYFYSVFSWTVTDLILCLFGRCHLFNPVVGISHIFLFILVGDIVEILLVMQPTEIQYSYHALPNCIDS